MRFEKRLHKLLHCTRQHRQQASADSTRNNAREEIEHDTAELGLSHCWSVPWVGATYVILILVMACVHVDDSAASCMH